MRELFPKTAAAMVAEAWGADTRRRIELSGLWPDDLEKWLVESDQHERKGVHHGS